MIFDEEAARRMFVAGLIALLIYGVGRTAPERHRMLADFIDIAVSTQDIGLALACAEPGTNEAECIGIAAYPLAATETLAVTTGSPMRLPAFSGRQLTPR